LNHGIVKTLGGKNILPPSRLCPTSKGCQSYGHDIGRINFLKLQKVLLFKMTTKKQDYFIEESYEPSTQDIQAVVDFLTSHSLTIPPPQILIHAWLCGTPSPHTTAESKLIHVAYIISMNPFHHNIKIILL
jgi:hypothetical protein